MSYAVVVTELRRPKNRESSWTYSVVDSAHREVFDSSMVAVRAQDELTAKWLGDVVLSALQAGATGAQLRTRLVPEASWLGDLSDDCTLAFGSFLAHAEHMAGPRRGGSWWCAVSAHATGASIFSSSDLTAVIKSGPAARWLCEVTLFLLFRGITLPSVPRGL